MAEKDAFLVDYIEGGLCVDYTDAKIVGRCNSRSDKNKSKELWDSLKSKYMAKDSSSKKCLVSYFNNYKMVDSRPVMEQYNELLRILGQYTQHGLKMNESISISSIIDKFPPSWKDFKHTLKHGKDDLSLVQLGSHLRIEESLRAQDSDKGKGKEVGGPSVNMTEEGVRTNITNKTKVKSDPMRTTVVLVLTRNQSWNVGSVVRLVTSKGIAEVVDALAWWIDSGATTHVCKDHCWLKTYEPVKDRFVLYMGDDHFAPVHGKGSVTLEFSSGKTITLFNVLYILFMSSSTVVNSSLWHARLGHVHNKRMLEMSKDNLIPAIDENLENVLLRVWGCRAVVRLPDQKRKTLGEKGIDCIFVRYAEHSKAYSIEEDPRTYNEAMKSRDSAFWKEAIDDEIGSIMENNTWVLFDLPPGCKPLGCKCIFKMKMKVDGTVDKFKARLVIQGFRQKEGIDYFDTYAPVARITTIRLLLALVAIHNPVIHQTDVKTAFLNGDLDEEVYMKRPKGFIMPFNKHKKSLNTGKPVDHLEYSRAIGCLMYAMTSTRPDTAYVVGRLSRFTSNPSRQHWKAITMVFKYLRGTKDYGLSYVGYPLVLEGAISWASKKQTCITGSTMESGFVALAAAGVRHSMVRELIRNGVISIEFVQTQHNLADHLTKGLARDWVYKGHILNGMSDSLFDVYTNVTSAKELWDSLESKYMAEDSSSKKFLMSYFNNYKMVDSRPVMEQYNELLRILGQYTQHGLKMNESIFVSSIIDKFPPSWKDFKHTLKHGKDDLSLVQLGSHLRIEESLRAQDSDKGKGKEVGGPSVNMTEEGVRTSITNKTKVKSDPMRTTVVLVPTRNQSWNVGSVVRQVTSKGIAEVIDSGATTHVCKDRCWLKTYEPVEDGSVLYMGDDHFAPFHGIIHETIAPYTPQQNGVAERKNKALKKMVNSMLSYTGLSEGFWGEAMLTACYLLNRVPNKRNKTTPYELWYK
nr:zinc finger, CCHC-type [Tanacetum cinerariifolium]